MIKIKRILISASLLSFLLIVIIAFNINNKGSFILGHASDTGNIVVNINLEPEYYEVSPGKNLIAELKIVQLNNGNARDISVHSYLLDQNNNSFRFNDNVYSLETQASVVIAGSIPLEAKEGTYYLVAEVRDSISNEELGKATQRILVKNKIFIININSIYIISLWISIIAVLAGLIIIYIKMRKRKN